MTKKNMLPIEVAQTKAVQFGYEFVNLRELRLTDDLIAAIPSHVAQRYRAIPVTRQGDVIAVALTDPSDLDTIDALRRLLKTEIELRVASDEDIEAALRRYYT